MGAAKGKNKAQKALARITRGFQPDAALLASRPLPGAARWSLYLLLAAVIFFVVWASVSRVDRIVVARGKLVTVSPTIVVQPLETSLVRDIKVRVGQMVKKGQVLGSLDATFTEVDVSQVKARLEALNASLKRLAAEKSGKSEVKWNLGLKAERLEKGLFISRALRHKARLRSFDKALARLKASLTTNLGNQRMQKKRLSRLVAIEKMRTSLLKSHHESRLKVLEAQNARLAVEQELRQAVNQQREIVQELAKTRAEREGYLESWKQEIDEALIKATAEKRNTALQLEAAQKRKDLILLRSPQDAMVLEVAKRSVGSVVRAAETLFVLVPAHDPLEAEVRIPSRDVGFVRTGDKVRIKFDAFPFQKHGTASGVVRFLSEDALNQTKGGDGEDKAAETGVYFRARLTLQSTRLRQVPRDFRLIPGMTVTAEIKVGTRVLMTYFLYPIIRAWDESLREP